MADLNEIDAMKKIADALEPLDSAARLRALNWAFSRYRGAGREGDGRPAHAQAIAMGDTGQGSAASFQTFAELFDAAKPNTERDKALVAAYWVQVCQNVESFPAQSLNDELKHLGHRVGNITDALTQLKDLRPALVLQLKKSGASKQARKTYRLTQEGARRVQQMMQGNTL